MPVCQLCYPGRKAKGHQQGQPLLAPSFGKHPQNTSRIGKSRLSFLWKLRAKIKSEASLNPIQHMQEKALIQLAKSDNKKVHVL